MPYGDWKFSATVYDRRGAYAGECECLSASWTKSVQGEDTLTLESTAALEKGDRVVWRDWRGTWHENVADESTADRQTGRPVYTTVCRTPLLDLESFHVEDMRPKKKSGKAALAQLLSGTTWDAGDTVSDTASTSWYRCSALEALEDFAEKWGTELSYVVDVDSAGVTARRVLAPKALGTDSGRRFDYRRDLVGVRRAVSTGTVYTALYGYGKGEEVGDGYGRRITFEKVNPAGTAWVGDDDAREAWGVPDGKGGMLHSFGSVEYDDCEDPEELLRLTRAALETAKAPQVSYTLDAAAASAAGLGVDDTSVGDIVEFVDGAFEPPLRGTARVTSMTVDLSNVSTASIELGNAADGLSNRLASLEQRMTSIRAQSAAWQAAASAAPDYMRDVLAGVNSLATAGKSYWAITPDNGIVVSNCPLDQVTGQPTQVVANPGAIRLRSGVVQTTTAVTGGEWDWTSATTAIRGGGIVANAITTGVIAGADYWAGKGGAHWDLEPGGSLVMEGYATTEDLAAAKWVQGTATAYAVGSSGTEAPETGWSASVPDVPAGMYLWARTSTALSDGTSSVAYSVAYRAEDGKDGAPGRDGTDGAAGLQGPAGKDGASTYFHRAYAESADGSQGFSVTYGAGKSYLGTYVDGVPGDSSDPARYTWSLIKGADGRDGADGEPGVDGRDGTTYYLHRAYAESADGKAGFSTTVTAGKSYMGTCVDTTKGDPSDPAVYQWALIKGADGKDGVDGKDGTQGADGKDGDSVASTSQQYYLSDTKDGTAPTGGRWADTMPDFVPGKYIWTRLAVTMRPADGDVYLVFASTTYRDDLTSAAEEAAKVRNFSELTDTALTLGRKQAGAFSGLRTVTDADGFHIVSEEGVELARYDNAGETFFDSDGKPIGYASYKQASYMDDGQQVTTNAMTLGGADMAKLWGTVLASLELTNGKTGMDYKTAHVSCAYPTGTTAEDPCVDMYAYAGGKMTQFLVRPDGLLCTGMAIVKGSYSVTTGIDVRKHMGVCVVTINGVRPGSTIYAGSYRQLFTLKEGYRPSSTARAVATLVNDDGVSAILTVGGDGVAYVHARGSDLEAGVLVWGQVTFFAEQ